MKSLGSFDDLVTTSVRLALTVAVLLLGWYSLQPASVSRRNLLMLNWLRLVPWQQIDKKDLMWPSEVTEYSRSKFGLLARQFDTLWRADSSTGDLIQLRSHMADLIAYGIQDGTVKLLEGFRSESFEKVAFAALIGDVGYACGDHDLALDVWRQYLPPNIIIYQVGILIEGGDYQSASVLLTQLGRHYVPDSGRQRLKLAQILSKLAIAGAQDSDLDDAESYWRWALLQLPEHAFYYHGLASTLARQSRLEESIAAYRCAIQIDPNRVVYHIGLAHALIRAEKKDQAILVVQWAYELEPDNRTVQQLLERLKRD